MFLGLGNLIEWLTELRKTFTYICQFAIKYMIEDLDGRWCGDKEMGMELPRRLLLHL